jgi:hypothetical protein
MPVSGEPSLNQMPLDNFRSGINVEYGMENRYIIHLLVLIPLENISLKRV